MINLTTFFTSLGIVNGNTQAKSFYDFWYGIEFSDNTITYNITDFMTYLGTTRYEFFKSLNSEYPDVYDEYTFYKNIDDVRIYDFKTFYEYAGEYFGGTPTPTPFAWRYNDFYGTGECGIIDNSLPIFYTNTEFPLPGDIVYSDSGLTTTFVGGGTGIYYQWGLPIEVYGRGVWEIDADGTILTNNTNCLFGFFASSGSTSSTCQTEREDEFVYVIAQSPPYRAVVLNGDNNIIGYFNGGDLYYTSFNGFFQPQDNYRIDEDGYITEIIPCFSPTYSYEICRSDNSIDACDYPTSCISIETCWFENEIPEVDDYVLYFNGAYYTPFIIPGEIYYVGIDELGIVLEVDGDTAIILSVNYC